MNTAPALVDPLAGRMFYMGAKPNFLLHTDVPLFVSDPNLRDKKTLRPARGPYAVDSGGFTQLSEDGTWDTGPSPRQYIHNLHRYDEHIGPYDWAAPQDWMCEEQIVAKTGLSVREHVHRTVGNYLDLKAIDPTVRIIPVVQGSKPADYEYCIDLYDRSGIDLNKLPVVGVGSVCRIQATDEAAEIIQTVANILGPKRIHGFGFKLDGLRRVGHLLGSADSHAWSFDGRNTPAAGCDFRLSRDVPHKSEANCLRFALAWRRKALAAFREGVMAPRQLAFDFTEAA